MNRFVRTSLVPGALACLLLAHGAARAEAVRVELVRSGEHWQLLRAGVPYAIRGAGGDGDLALLAASGANSIRTWDVEGIGPRLDAAQRLGLTVTVGFWLGHERHGFDYGDAKQLAAQYARVREGVLRYKDHPAVLAWAMGNEMEGYADGGDPRIWAVVDSCAAIAKALDPNHPTMTVTADIGAKRVESVHRLCPHVDIAGINSYGGAPSIPERWRAAGGTKPYVVTEYGPPGTWEIGRNAWGAVEELSSTAKAERYAATWRTLRADSALCLGSYAFTWGAKQEATATWYGMLLPDGSRLAAVDRMAEEWSGRAPVNRCPVVDALVVEGASAVAPGGRLRVRLAVRDPELDSLRVEWTLRADAMSYETGGDVRPAPRAYPECVLRAGADGAELALPKRTGRYRLSVVVRDGHGGAAIANVPLRVTGRAQDEPLADPVDLPFVVVGDGAVAAYAPSGWMGDHTSLTMDARSTGQPHAGATCVKFSYARLEGWCGVAWQDPPNDWGRLPGGYDLSGATRLSFWVRGAQGGERVKFGFGMIGADQKYGDTAKGEREVTLSREWTRVEIPAKGRDLRRIKTGFWWSLGGQGVPVTFWIDDVKWE
ncbi:MAG: glycoside hydrolase family 2 TIM barrel-domain containing protein [Candidatus Eisenbacteria bacterium]